MLECKEVSVTYSRKIRALSEVSLRVEQGEIVTLVGANGAGKSTLLKTISGLLRADEGEILLEGTAIHHFAAHQIAALGIAHVPEGRRVFSRLTVKENLELGAYISKEKKGADEVYRLFPVLEERKNQPAGTLSGGEQQMLAIGRALMSRPKLLMLDEPSMGLAPLLVERIFQAIGEINQEGTTILLVEQNAHQALSIAHRGYVMETGRIVLEATCKELLKNELVRSAYLGE